MKLILTRHGETEENKRKELMGHMPGKLSLLGIEQAKKVAEKLKDVHIDYIFSSDLARASDTAKEIHKFHPKTPIKFVKELRELKMGKFEGKVIPENWGETVENLDSFRASGGEGLDEIVERARNFFSEVLDKFYGKTVLLVAHSGTIKAILTAIEDKSWEHMKNIKSLENAEVAILEFDKGKTHSVKFINSLEPLK